MSNKELYHYLKKHYETFKADFEDILSDFYHNPKYIIEQLSYLSQDFQENIEELGLKVEEMEEE